MSSGDVSKYSFKTWDDAMRPESIDRVLKNFEVYMYSSRDNQTRAELHMPLEAREEDYKRLEFMDKAALKIEEKLEKYEPISAWRTYLNSFRQSECMFRVMYPMIYGMLAYSRNAVLPPGTWNLMGILALVMEPAVFLTTRYRRSKSKELLEDAHNRISVMYKDRIPLAMEV